MKKNPMNQSTNSSLLGTIVFWIHLAVMLAYFLSGFFFSIEVVVIITLLLQLHLLVFGGCIITKFQHKIGSVPENEEFIPYFIERTFKIELGDLGSSVVFFAITAFPMIVAIIR